MRNVIWLGFSIPNEVAADLFALDPMPAIQTHKFGWSFARALNLVFQNVVLVSACPVQSYPLVRRLLFYRGKFTCHGMSGIIIGFVNIIVLKHVTRFVACILSVLPFIIRRRIDWIFVHGLHTPFLLFSLITRLFGCRVAVVLTDPPGVVLSTDSKVARMLKNLDVRLIRLMLGHVDAVIALAPDLANRLAPDRPALIFPGIMESTLNLPAVNQGITAVVESNQKPFTIIYAGGLSSAYGVDRLVDAVLGLESTTQVCLKLYGRGDQETYLRQVATQDSRIVYGGFIDSATLLPELCNADLLVNPRPTNELFASMSFPSKLIEYLATGRPVLTTRLSSIPASLLTHFYLISDESSIGIRSAINSLMQLPEKERFDHGLAAQRFLFENYSESAIGQKIAKFINNLNCKYIKER